MFYRLQKISTVFFNSFWLSRITIFQRIYQNLVNYKLIKITYVSCVSKSDNKSNRKSFFRVVFLFKQQKIIEDVKYN